jgi:hypothetical protein
MRRATCLLVILLAACGNDAGRIAASPTPGSGYRSEPVEWFLRSIADDGSSIAIVYQMSGVASDCQREGEVSVDAATGKTLVTAHRLVTLDTNRACTEELAYVDEVVTMPRPITDDTILVGCRPGFVTDDEDEICRDLERSRDAGVFEFSPTPVPHPDDSG